MCDCRPRISNGFLRGGPVCGCWIHRLQKLLNGGLSSFVWLICVCIVRFRNIPPYHGCIELVKLLKLWCWKLLISRRGIMPKLRCRNFSSSRRFFVVLVVRCGLVPNKQRPDRMHYLRCWASFVVNRTGYEHLLVLPRRKGCDRGVLRLLELPCRHIPGIFWAAGMR